MKNLIFYPNNILFTACQPVLVFDEALKELVEEMKTIMLANKGIGLAANQIGVSQSIFIIKDKKEKIITFINPKIVDTDGTTMMVEGCLSAPHIFLPVTRPETVVIQYQDVMGEPHRDMATDLEARTILHEYEHLEGKFYFDKVNRTQRKIAISKLRKYI